MAGIHVVVRIDEPGVPAETLRAMVQSMKAAAGAVLSSPVAAGQEVTIVGSVKDAHEPLMPFFTGEAE